MNFSGVMTGRYSGGPQKPCRECKHNIGAHFKRYQVETFSCVHCPCLDYVPSDNLAWLEWKYNQGALNETPRE